MKEWDKFVIGDNCTIYEMQEMFEIDKPEIGGADTETTGLHIIKDKAFIIVFGWYRKVFIFEPTNENMSVFFECAGQLKTLYFWNTKYDLHMMYNCGYKYPHNNLSDGMFIARLTEYADDTASIALKQIAKRYIKIDANEYEKVLKGCLKNIKKYKPDANYSDIPTDILYVYAHHDVIYMLEYIELAYPTIKMTKQEPVLDRENRIIWALWEMERVGLKVDIDYLDEAEEKVRLYREYTQKELDEVLGVSLTAGQHAKLKAWFNERLPKPISSVDKASIRQISGSDEVNKAVSLITELRTLDKWYSTYITGLIGKVYEGRIYTSINQAGATTGRVSSDLQQMPNKPLKDRYGNTLFSPRRCVVVTGGVYSKIAYIDYSQVELRLQAIYTILCGQGDLNLCRAYIPYKYISNITGEVFDIKKHQWDSGEWIDPKTGEAWTPTDLHTATTIKAFPELDVNSKEFKQARGQGKTTNFAKVYGCGVDTLIAQNGFERSVAEALDRGFNEAFPQIKTYQQWILRTLKSQGFVENLMGRRYYAQSSENGYKFFNYPIQGSGADFLKEKIYEIYQFFKANPTLKSRFQMNIHDEMSFEICNGEDWIIPKLKEIMEDTSKWANLCLIPIIAEVSETTTNWSEKE